ncbi:SDR family NAD(P)-dependent oxidoreductase [Paeniglutamicibacter sp. NPDC091659]|uniref:SDR family NAD(P)-dependent oxidoreductase n=1 Tax=Paeniglutamicibacter sp. NPDC091659 TaxID=3364389 RepID=UPI0038276BB3
MSTLPNERLDGRVALVTGAARGMGAAHASTLAARGADLLLIDLDEAELTALAAQLRENTGVRVVTLSADITAPGAAETFAATAVDQLGGLDILVHNAGIMHDFKTLEQTDAAALRPYFEVNVLAPYAITRAALGALRASKSPRVIFISSSWGQVPDGHSYGYMISKAAQLSMMRALAKELVAEGILVNAVTPGAVATRMIPDEVYAEELAAVPLGRLADPLEIAASVAFLASDQASFITGQTLNVNGGALIVGV